MLISKKIRRKLYLITAILIILILFVIASDTSVTITEYTVRNEKISFPFTAVLVTDLHSCSYGENQEILLSEIDKLNPDIIFLAGDIFDDKLSDNNAITLLSQISKKYHCYYVSGNHEFWSQNITKIKNTIENMGIYVMEGESTNVTICGQSIAICGIDDPEVGEDIFSNQLISCSNDISENTFSILLSHRPERISQYAKYGFDLVLSGHAHGGQVRIPGIIDGLYAPNQGFFPEYAGGIKEYENTKIIISRGLAKESTKLPRIFNPPELVYIRFEPQY